MRLALELASSRIADWSAARVLIVGTGRYAATTVDAVRARGAADIHVFSPSGRAAAFAAKHGLIAETSFPDAAAERRRRHHLHRRRGRARRCVRGRAAACSSSTSDCRATSIPRSVAVDGVELLDLETIRLHAPLEEFSAHADARAIVGDAATEFAADRAAGPAITALRQDVLRVVEEEIARARARGAGDETEAALRHLAGVLLHRPSVRIRELAVEGRIDEVARRARDAPRPRRDGCDARTPRLVRDA